MRRRTASWPAILAVAVSLVTACGGTVAPGGSSGSSALPDPSAPAGSGPVAVGPASFTPPVVDVNDDLARSLALVEDEDQARLRTEAGSPAAAGPGWDAMVEAADAALDGALRSWPRTLTSIRRSGAGRVDSRRLQARRRWTGRSRRRRLPPWL